jgi:sulfatase maturation enzyme AslB (radical SAM superfamily)
LREISNFVGINIVLNINPCAHDCRYCFFDNHKNSKLPISRFLAIIERFLDWKQSCRRKKFDVSFVLFHSDDYDLATTKRMIELQARNKSNMQLFLGGLRMRSEKEMRIWLQERQKLGIRNVVASFLGHGAVHDSWNGRPGDFDFLMSTLKIAAELGMEMEQRLFLIKSTLPHMEELIDKLDMLPNKVRKRSVCPLDYSGRADKLEAERLTEADLKYLPERVSRFLTAVRSEREWIEFIRQREDPPKKKGVLKFYLDDTNIDRIEAMSCDAIVAELEQRVRTAYAALPTQRELCEACGDPNSTLLYSFWSELERKWLDKYLEQHPIQFEREITMLGMYRE